MLSMPIKRARSSTGEDGDSVDHQPSKSLKMDHPMDASLSMATVSEPEDGEVEFEDGEISDDSSDPEAFALAIVKPAFRPRAFKSSSNLRGPSTSSAARPDPHKFSAHIRTQGIDTYNGHNRYAPPRSDNLRSSGGPKSGEIESPGRRLVLADRFVAPASLRGPSGAEAMYRQCVSYIQDLRACGMSAEHMISKGVSKRLVHDAFAAYDHELAVQNTVNRAAAVVVADVANGIPAVQPYAVSLPSSTSTLSSSGTMASSVSPTISVVAPLPLRQTCSNITADPPDVRLSLSPALPATDSQNATTSGIVDAPVATEESVSHAMQAQPSSDSTGSSMSLESTVDLVADLVAVPPAVLPASPIQRISISLPPKPISPVTKRTTPPPEILSMQASVQKLSNKLPSSLPPRPTFVTTEPNAIQSNMRGFTELEVREANVKALLRRRAPAKKLTDDNTGVASTSSSTPSSLIDEPTIAYTGNNAEPPHKTVLQGPQPSSSSRANSMLSSTSGSSRSASPVSLAEEVMAIAVPTSVSNTRTPKRPLAFDFEEEPTSTLPLKLQKTTLRPFCTARSIETIIFDDDEESSHQIVETPYIAALRSNFRACRLALAMPTLTSTTYRAPLIQDSSRASTPVDIHNATPVTAKSIASPAVLASRIPAGQDTEQTKLAQTEAALLALKARLAAIEEARAKRQSSQSVASTIAGTTDVLAD